MKPARIFKTTELQSAQRVRLPLNKDESHEDRHTVVGVHEVKLESQGNRWLDCDEGFYMVELRNDRTGREDFHMVAPGFEWVEWLPE